MRHQGEELLGHLLQAHHIGDRLGVVRGIHRVNGHDESKAGLAFPIQPHVPKATLPGRVFLQDIDKAVFFQRGQKFAGHEDLTAGCDHGDSGNPFPHHIGVDFQSRGRSYKVVGLGHFLQVVPQEIFRPFPLVGRRRFVQQGVDVDFLGLVGGDGTQNIKLGAEPGLHRRPAGLRHQPHLGLPIPQRPFFLRLHERQDPQNASHGENR